MKATVPAFLAAALLATGAAAQSSAPPAPAQEPATRKASPPLNLKLDDADVRRAVTFSPREGGEPRAADGLPSLGGNATRSFDSVPSPIDRGSTPFPKDTENTR